MAWFLPVFLVVLGAACIAVLVAVFLVQRTLQPDPTVVDIRLKNLKQSPTAHLAETEAEAVEAKVAALFKSELYKNAKLGKALARFSWFAALQTLLIQAGMPHLPPDKVVTDSALGVILGLLGAVLFKMPLLGVIGLLVPVFFYGVLVFQKKKRYKAFMTQLPPSMSLMCSALRAGHAFQSSLGLVATDMKDPIAGVFKQVVGDLNLGLSVREALYKMYDNVAVSDTHIFVTAVLIQRESGGNLAELLDKLGFTIRERFKLKRHISALTAQSRLTGYVVGAAPTVMFLVFYFFFPGYFRPMTEHIFGQIALCFALFMQLVGFWVIGKIVNIRV